MPEQMVGQCAKKKAREGRAPSTQAGEFVREEMEHIRQRKHGARSTKQSYSDRSIQSQEGRSCSAAAREKDYHKKDTAAVPESLFRKAFPSDA
jgi:hypothetical protein